MIRTLLAVLVLTCVASAQIVAPQPISVTGVLKVNDQQGAGVLCAPGTHLMECAEGLVQFRSKSINLDGLVGQNVQLTAIQTSKQCPLYEVTAVQMIPEATLTLCGTAGGLGCPIRLRSGPGGLSQHWLLVSAFPGWWPVNLTEGTFLLGQPFLVLPSGAGQFGIDGAAWDFNIPGDPSLIGLEVFLQSARRDVGPVSPIRYSNAVCFEIIGFTLLCAEPDC